jgi:hypothetical protein
MGREYNNDNLIEKVNSVSLGGGEGAERDI